MSRRILEWTVGAALKSPVRVHELWEAIAVPEDVEAALQCRKDPIVRRLILLANEWNQFKRVLYDHCGPFVEIICPDETRDLWLDPQEGTAYTVVEPTWIVQLFHQTTKEFLSNPAAAGPLHIDLSSVSTRVEDRCHEYMRIILPLTPTKYSPRTERSEDRP